MLRTTQGVIAAVVSGILGLHGRAQAQDQWQMLDPQPSISAVGSISVSSPNTFETFMLSADPDGTWISYGGSFPSTPPKLRWEFNKPLHIYHVHTSRVAYAPSDPLTVYDLNDDRIVTKSTDGGAIWTTSLGFTTNARPWRALTVHPTDKNIVLIGGLDPGTGGPRSISRTTNGNTWKDASSGAPQRVTVTDFEFDRWDTATTMDVWAATATVAPGSTGPRVGVLYSADETNWTNVLLDPVASSNKNQVYAIAVAAPVAGFPQSFLAATEAGLYRCTSGTSNCSLQGSLWISLNVPVSPPRINDVFFAQDTVGANPGPKIWVATEQGVLRGDVNTTTGAVAWNTTSFPTSSVTALGSTFSTGERLYAGYANGDVWGTLDEGATVFRVVGQHGAYPVGTLARISGDKIYAGTVCQQGLFRYDGTSWAKHPSDYNPKTFGPFHYAMRIVVAPNNSLVAYATFDNLFKTTNGGETWTDLTATTNLSDTTHLHGIAVSPRDSTGNTLYLSSGHGIWGHEDQNADPPRYWKSTDGGASWTPPTLFCAPGSTIPDCNNTAFHRVFVQGWDDTIESSLFDIAVSPLDPDGDGDDVYIATFGHEQFPADYTWGRGQGVLRSTNGGATWELLKTGLSIDGQSVGRITMHNYTGDQVNTYIATLGGVYKMVGNGSSWGSPILAGRFESVASDPVNLNVLYAGTSPNQGAGPIIPAQIYRSSDAGSTWTPMTITMPTFSAWTVTSPQSGSYPNYRVRDFAVGSSNVYASVEGAGIYFFTVSGCR